jgi:hypothetical protein
MQSQLLAFTLPLNHLASLTTLPYPGTLSKFPRPLLLLLVPIAAAIAITLPLLLLLLVIAVITSVIVLSFIFVKFECMACLPQVGLAFPRCLAFSC